MTTELDLPDERAVQEDVQARLDAEALVDAYLDKLRSRRIARHVHLRLLFGAVTAVAGMAAAALGIGQTTLFPLLASLVLATLLALTACAPWCLPVADPRWLPKRRRPIAVLPIAYLRGERRTRHYVEKRLRALLADLTPDEARHLPERSLDALITIARSSKATARLRRSVLDALSRIGEVRAIPAVQRVLALMSLDKSLSTAGVRVLRGCDDEDAAMLRDAAWSCLQALEARRAELAKHDTLLRPARAPVDETLLRPASGPPATPEELLLRPADPQAPAP